MIKSSFVSKKNIPKKRMIILLINFDSPKMGFALPYSIFSIQVIFLRDFSFQIRRAVISVWIWLFCFGFLTTAIRIENQVDLQLFLLCSFFGHEFITSKNYYFMKMIEYNKWTIILFYYARKIIFWKLIHGLIIIS